MIKINLEKKLQNQGLKLQNFKNDYIKSILDYKHFIVTRKSDGSLKDRFNFGIRNANLTREQTTQYKLEKIFFRLYQNDVNLYNFINRIFNVLHNVDESRILLEKILLMKPDDLKIIVNQVNSSINVNLKEILLIIFNYDRDRKRISELFIKVDFRVCIYCNRNFISNFHSKKSLRATFTLDHFYQKDKIPLLALSLYNLVPSCSVCNTNIKNTRDVEQYENPYSLNYDFHSKAKFKLMPNYKIKLESYDNRCSKYIEDFYHNEIYNTHSLEVKELVKKRDVFTDDLIKKISKLTKHSESSIKGFLFGDILYKDEMDNDSLAKLKVDISKELKII